MLVQKDLPKLLLIAVIKRAGRPNQAKRSQDESLHLQWVRPLAPDDLVGPADGEDNGYLNSHPHLVTFEMRSSPQLRETDNPCDNPPSLK